MGLLDEINGLTEDQMAGMPWDKLIEYRKGIDMNHPVQNKLAPYEHRAWAREQVAQNPVNALAYALMVPGYQAGKAVMSFAPGETKPSLNHFPILAIRQYHSFPNISLSQRVISQPFQSRQRHGR